MSQAREEDGNETNMLEEAQKFLVDKSDVVAPHEGSNTPPTMVETPQGVKRERTGEVKENGEKGKEKEDCDQKKEHDEQMHILTERERRKKMREMFTNLHALLPRFPSKVDKSTIIDEATNYIRNLEHTLHKLQKQKLDKLRELNLRMIPLPPLPMLETREAVLANHVKNWATTEASPAAGMVETPLSFLTYSTPNMTLSISGLDAHFGICAVKKPGVLSAIIHVLEQHKVEVVTAQVCSHGFKFMCMIHASASWALTQSSEKVGVDEIYRMAAGDISLRILLNQNN